MSTKIFIVEDNLFYGMLLKTEIEKSVQGEIEMFQTGEMFLINLKRNPDIVILDYHLGTMNGVDLLKQIKTEYPKVRIILLSAQESMNVAVLSLKHGAYEYIEKNIYAFPRISYLIREIQMEIANKKENRINNQIIYSILTLGLITLLFLN